MQTTTLYPLPGYVTLFTSLYSTLTVAMNMHSFLTMEISQGFPMVKIFLEGKAQPVAIPSPLLSSPSPDKGDPGLRETWGAAAAPLFPVPRGSGVLGEDSL